MSASDESSHTPILTPLVLALAFYVWFSSRHLPALVASHFDANGAANGHMPRSVYLGVTLVLVCGVPLLLAWLPGRSLGPNARINIPNRDYWLAPARREQTLAYIRRQMRVFAGFTALFLAYVHSLVVQANALPVPQLSSSGIATGLVVLAAATLLWLLRFMRYFRVPQ